MLLKAKKFCKKIFRYAGVTGQRLTGSAGLFLLKDYMVKTGLRPTLEKLKKDGFRLRLVLDSGYENTAVFDYLESEGIEFICAAKQRKGVKLGGRNAKNRTLLKEKGNVTAFIKERKLNTPEGSEFRQIYVQNRIACDEHGQLYFKEFDSGEFTNVFVTNMKIARKNIYKIYRKHASVETVIEELKNDFGLAASHSMFFPVNCAMAQTCAIAYNVKNMFVAEYSVLRNKKETVKLSTFQRKFINIPGIIANRSGRTVLRLEHSAFQKLKGYFSIFGYNINAFS